MAKSMPITGRVLEWTLSDRGVDSAAAAEQLGVSGALVQQWIDEEATPNKGQFNKLVQLLRCTPSFLFLPEPPSQSRVPEVKFRRHSDAPEDVPIETANAIQTARAALRVAHWLALRSEEIDVHSLHVPRAELNDDPEEVAAKLRSWLNWSSQEQTGRGSTDSSAAKAMRASLQRHGILALHLTMDEGITRGFSLHQDDISLIAVNTRDHVRARMFSYAHELAHLALQDDSVCLTRNNSGIEAYCNRVAAAVLMPREAFHMFVAERLNSRVETRENVVSIRNHFKVSLQAATIRATHLLVAPESLYEQIGHEVEPKTRGGTYRPGEERTKPRVRVDQYGSGFVTSLLDAEESGRLRRSQVLDLLRLSDRELESVRDLAISGVTG